MANIYFWQNIPSIHQAPFIRALAERCTGNICVITEEQVYEKRRQMGWKMPDFGKAKLIVCPAPQVRMEIINAIEADSLHFFSGLKVYKATHHTLKIISKKKVGLIAVIAEAGRSDQGLKTIMRKIKHKILAVIWRDKVDLVLATGSLGVDWWRQAGFKASQLVEWGYYVSVPDLITKSSEAADSGYFEIIMVSSLIKRKNHRLLLEALHKLDGWRLSLIGDGDQREQIQRLARELGIQHKIRFVGGIANEEVFQFLAKSDLLILPSTFDGWGAVINESLSMGTPVICSSNCGAKSLLKEKWLGAEFNNTIELKKLISSRLEEGKVNAEERRKIRSWAERHISPEAAAERLIGCIEERVNKGVPEWG